MDQVKYGTELISRLMDHLCARLSGCRGVGLSVWPEAVPLRAVGVAADLDRAQLAAGEGPLVDAAHGERQITGQVDGVDLVAVPGSWGEDGPIVLSVYLDHPPRAEDLRAIEEFEPLLATAAGVIEFCSGAVLRADQLARMVQSRRYIEQAKGLVMAGRSCQPGEAFELLVRASQHANVKLRDVCTALVLVVGGALEDSMDGTITVSPPDIALDTAKRLWAALRV